MSFRSWCHAPSPLFPRLPWSPHWEIVVHHERADHEPALPGGRPALCNRHVRPVPPADWTSSVQRDSPGWDETPLGCHVSAASLPPQVSPPDGPEERAIHKWPPEAIAGGRLFQPGDGKSAHQRDWDFLAQTASDCLARAGVPHSAPVLDKVMAFAELQNRHKGPVYPSRHPVDTLLFSSYCTGVANAMAALCMVSGIPARTIHNAVHSMTEIHDGNRWFFVNNFTARQEELYRFGPESLTHTVHPDRNYIMMLLDPRDPAGNRLAPELEQKYLCEMPPFEPWLSTECRFWRFDHGRRGIGPTLDPFSAGLGAFLLPCPDNILAIYPEWPEPLFPSRTGHPGRLSLNPRQGWLETILRLDRGMGLRRQFFLGGLEDADNPVLGVVADLYLDEASGAEFDPLRAGWCCSLNGRALSLDRDRCEFTPARLRLVLPMDYLLENSINELILYSDSSYRERTMYRMPDVLPFLAYPDPLGLAGDWYDFDRLPDYNPKEEPPEGRPRVRNTHTAWTLIHGGMG